MKRTRWLLVAVVSSAIILALTLATPSLARSTPAASPAATIDDQLPEPFQEVIIYLKKSTDLTSTSLPTEKLARRTEVIQRLQTTAETSQAQLITYLENQQQDGMVQSFQSLWIINAMLASVQPDLIDTLVAMPEVERVAPDETITLLSSPEAMVETAPTRLTWGLQQIRAQHAWEALGINGSGVTIAVMDTGVDWRHPALLNNYRGNLPNGSNHVYNWFDPVGYSAVPIDPNGHGTHVAGTAVGSPYIGVAPGAKWIAVRALDSTGGGQLGDIHQAFQWLLAPGGNPAKAPDIVNNSWSGGPELTEFIPDVAALKAAGIIPIFAAGNLGPAPGTVGAPANYPGVLAIGASDDLDAVAWFSGRGPSNLTNEYKPTFVAPGAHVLSARPDGEYAFLNGTSMATPHAVGAYALLLSANPNLTPEQITTIITGSAVPIAPTHPNHVSGWGRLDVYNALLSQVSTGVLTGLVVDWATPKPGLVVTVTTISGAELPFVTGPDGRFQANLRPGVYSLTTAPFGYQPQQITNLVVQANQTTTQNLYLTRLPNGLVSGTVRRPDGTPLSGTIRFANTPVVRSTQAGGFYQARLPAGQYEVIAAVSGYRLGRGTINIPANGTTAKDFILVPGPATLLVDAGQVKYNSQARYFETAIEDSDYAYDYWPVRDPTSDAPTLNDLLSYDVVVWSDPTDSPGDIGASQTLSDYLGLGGNLLISGQNIGQETQDPTNPPYWWQRQLRGQYIGKASAPFTLTAESGSLFTGITLTLNGPDSAANQLATDIVRPLPTGLTKPAFQYPDGQAGGLSSDFCGPYHIVYLGFGLEGVDGSDNRAAIIERSYTYFEQPEPVAGSQFLPPSIFRLAAPGSRITYTLSLVNRSETLTDTFSLNFGGTGWNTTIVTPTLTIGPCRRAETIVSIDIPTALPENSLETFWLRATSNNYPTVHDNLPFTLKSPGEILLVDDDRWYDRKAEYQAALDSAGIAYDFWETDTTNGGLGSPPGDLLNAYDIILWYTGYDWFQPITAEEAQNLYDYLSQGGRLFLSSQDYLFRHPDDPLTLEYLKLLQFTEPLTPTAVFGGPELAALGQLAGPLRLDYGPYQNFSDGLVPSSGSEVSIWHNQGMAGGIFNQGQTAAGDLWRLIFWAIPLETLPPDTHAETLNQIVAKLTDTGDSTFQVDRRTAPYAGPGMSRNYTITLKNNGIQPRQLWMTNTIPAELEIDLSTLAGGAVYDAQSGQLTWQGTIPPGAFHLIHYQASPTWPLPPGTQIDNLLEIHATNPSVTFQRKATYWVNAPDLLQSTFIAPNETIYPNDTISYQLLLYNDGLAPAQTTSATLRLPDALGLLTDTLQFSGGSAEINGRFLKWQGDIAVNQTITISIMMTTPFLMEPLWLPATTIIDDNVTAVIVKDTLFPLFPRQSYFPAIAKQ